VHEGDGTPDRKPLLRLRDVSVRFGGVTALDGVGFDVQSGEICGLIGPNGAGKTTLFNCITRLCRIAQGSIVFAGRRIEAVPARAVIGLGIARTFQNLGVYPQMTVLENVLLGAHHGVEHGIAGTLLRPRRAGREERTLKERCRAILRDLDLESVAEAPASALPYGSLKRVEIARALAASPRLLLLDEPAAGLTQAETAAFAELILQVREAFRLTVLLVEHHVGLVMSLCSRVVVLHVGRKLAEGPPAQIRSAPDVIEAYLGRAA
jgi:branched-chain amino acid transport system ATP-binding protein